MLSGQVPPVACSNSVRNWYPYREPRCRRASSPCLTLMATQYAYRVSPLTTPFAQDLHNCPHVDRQPSPVDQEVGRSHTGASCDKPLDRGWVRCGLGYAGAPGKGTVAGVMPAVTRHRVARIAQSISASRAIFRSSPVVPPTAWRQATAAPASSATASRSALDRSVTANGSAYAAAAAGGFAFSFVSRRIRASRRLR